MASQRYSFQGFDEKTMVKVMGRNLPISHKASFEVANFVKGKKVEWALKALDRVLEKTTAVPYKRYNADVAHKAGKIGPARYPAKVSIHLIALLKNLQGAARSKGLDQQKLTIIHAAVQKAPLRQRYGRKRGLLRKNAHFEFVAKEVEDKVKETKKTETKQEAKKQ
jgi:large subunit ribosomal protein L22